MSILSALLKFTEHHVIFFPRISERGSMLLRTVGNLRTIFRRFQASRSVSVRSVLPLSILPDHNMNALLVRDF